jgi:ferrous iron transport protein B
MSNEVAALARQIRPRSRHQAEAEALLLLSDERNLTENARRHAPEVAAVVEAARARLESAGVDWRSAAIEARYDCARAIHDAAVTEVNAVRETVSDRLDRIFTHKIWGTLIFMALMAAMFQSIFTFAKVPMDLLEGGVAWMGALVGSLLPPGDLRSLLVDGIIAGVGAVVVFLPQICLLFLFIGLLEDTGYMARAAFLMDRLMSKVGLHGKSFIPMLSSFACAIPGIMATRTIENPKDRLVTILIAPLMSCSARLPVYTLLIAACIPDRRVLGLFKLPGLTLLGMYLLGISLALVMAWIFKKTLLRGHTPLLIMELPPYKRPTASGLLRHTWERAKLFLRNAGTVILGFNILLWFLASYPRNGEIEKSFAERQQVLANQLAAASPDAAKTLRTELDVLETELAGERVRHSFAGWTGHAIEPLLRPLGFDWKIGIGIVTSFAAREIFVSTMSVVYNVSGGGDTDAVVPTLAETLRQQTRSDGTPMYTTLTGVTLMVFYVVALQCASTLAIVRRETNSWKWPIFQWAYMGTLAWLLAFVTYQGGRLLGFS